MPISTTRASRRQAGWPNSRPRIVSGAAVSALGVALVAAVPASAVNW